MHTRDSNKALTIASATTLAAALALSVPVVERLIAAIWQWYKFAGYSNDGRISLSFNTGLLFSGLLAAIFGLALMFNHAAKRRFAPRAKTWSLLAMCVVVAAATAYWALGLSNLNAWRA